MLKKPMALCLTLMLLSACAMKDMSGTDYWCSRDHLLTVSEADSPGTKREVLAHNDEGSVICAWN